ncbi:uncharacterized protein LOC116853526 [Odontomachus brunneus]|uniref:uncharacterized protein LOC116853526 n=1 Tax=Odontomachus brunneus TaxID=486640 RepID=UPI0013F1A8A0|nr:uncharacterized protein LOC116853526 [Odontomachus brunneus]
MGWTKAHKVIQMERCISRDRKTRYRGILKLYARDKKLRLSQATKLKSTVLRKLTSLEADVKNYRNVIKNLSKGDKLKSLDNHKEFCLAFRQLQSSELYADIFNDNDVKRRLLDKLYYEKKKKLKYTIELQLKCSDLLNECREENDNQSHCKQQLIVRLQRYISKYNAAKTIYSTYLPILNILKKDAMFFDTLLNILKEDQCLQCKTILRVTVMGQLAAENLDDVRQKYKQATRVILHNMRIREQMLNNVRFQVRDLWAYALSLVRVESDTVLIKKNTDESTADKIIDKQLVHLKDICDEVKEILFVRSYHDLLLRFDDQFKQRINLLARLNINIKNRDSLLSKTNYAIQICESLQYSKTAAEQYKTYGCEILELMHIEEKREKDFQELKKTYGELFTNIRAALQNMNMMLLYVKQPDRGMKKTGKDVGKDMLKELDDKEDTNELESLVELEEVDTNSE